MKFGRSDISSNSKNRSLIGLMNIQLPIPGIAPEEYIILVDNPEWLKHFTIINTTSKCLPGNNSLILLGSENGQFHKSERQSVFQHFQKLLHFCNNNFVLVQGKCDYPIPKTYIQQLPDSVIALYSNAVCENIPRLYYLPMGRDFRSKEVYLNKDFSDVKKDWLCYCNFSTDTWTPRKKVFNILKNKNFIYFDMGQSFLNYTISREQFYNRLARSKFAIAPRGNGADSFRFWDCLYLGTVPISVKEYYHKEFEGKIPMLLLNSYEDYGKLSKSFLEKKYRELCQKKYDYDLLKLSTWIKKIKDTRKEFCQ